MLTGRRNAQVTGYLIGSAGLLLLTCLVLQLFGVRINTTPSLPEGLYRITDDLGAPLVEFCPSGPFSALSGARGYRLAGICPDLYAPLLKPVVARERDIVTFTSAGLAVNDRLLPDTAPQPRDTRGRALEHWPYGTYRVERGTIWVASSYNPHSYDSRYFGPVPVQSIRHRLISLWTPLSNTNAF